MIRVVLYIFHIVYPYNRRQLIKKNGQTRWLNIYPIVWGVTMNTVHRPRGGGEGCTKGSRPRYHLGERPPKVDFKMG